MTSHNLNFLVIWGKNQLHQKQQNSKKLQTIRRKHIKPYNNEQSMLQMISFHIKVIKNIQKSRLTDGLTGGLTNRLS